MAKSIIIAGYLILLAVVTDTNNLEKMVINSLLGKYANISIISADLLSLIIAQMESSIKGRISCTTFIVDRSAYILGTNITKIN